MKNTFLLIPSIILSLSALAQHVPVYYELDSMHQGDRSYYRPAEDYISLKPGFSYKPNIYNMFCAEIYMGNQAYAKATYSDYIDPKTYEINDNLPYGTINGEFNVSMGGNTSYYIPIELPIAAVDLKPTIGVSYNSQGANKELGIGWGLVGMSQITKTNKSKYFDGFNESIKLNSDDAISLNGNRLLEIEAGDVNNVGAVYATEIENYDRITKTDNGYLLVKKDGTTLEFGYTNDSRILKTANNNQELGFLLNKVIDIYGNYYTIAYKDFGFGEVLPDVIYYSGNESSNLSPINTIKFKYMDRNDKSSMYVNGVEVKQTKLISGIEIFNKQELFRKYNFTYFYQGNSKLNRIDITGVNGEYYNPIVVGWENETIKCYRKKFTWQSYYEPIFTFGDYNGDGKTDLTKLDKKLTYNGMDRWQIRLGQYNTEGNNPVNLFKASHPHNNSLSEEFQEIYRKGKFNGLSITDFNGDGLEDILIINSGTIDGYFRTFYKTFKPLIATYMEGYDEINFIYDEENFPMSENFINDTRIVMTADLNGDSKSEILVFNKKADTDTTIFKVIHYADKQPVTDSLIMLNFMPKYPNELKIEDMDGDGKDDLCFFTDSSLTVCTYNMALNQFDTLMQEQFLKRDVRGRFFLLDINNDQFKDLIQLKYTNDNYLISDMYNPRGVIHYCQAYINTGNNNFIESNFGQDIFVPGRTIFFKNLYFLDVNKDGRSDIFMQTLNSNFGKEYVYGDPFTNHMYINYPNAISYTQPEVEDVTWLPKSQTHIGDFNGDGTVDFLAKNFENSGRNDYKFDFIFLKHNVYSENVVNCFVDGTGKQLIVNHKPLTAKDVFIRTSTVSVEKIIPMKVVNTVQYPQLDDNLSVTYQYRKPKWDFGGKGFVGMLSRLVTDSIKRISISTNGYYYDSGKMIIPNISSFERYIDTAVYSTIVTSDTKIQKIENNRIRIQPYKKEIRDFIAYKRREIISNYDDEGNLYSLKTNILDYNNESIISSQIEEYSYQMVGNGNFKNKISKETISQVQTGSDTVKLVKEYTYNPVNHLLEYKYINKDSARNKTVEYKYTSLGNHIAHTLTSTNEVDKNGNQYSTIKSEAPIYDADNRYTLGVTNNLGHTKTSLKFNYKLGLPIETKNENNQIEKYEYDGFGSLKKHINELGVVTEYKKYKYKGSDYPAGWMVEEVAVDGEGKERKIYDIQGNLIGTEKECFDNLLLKNRFEYDLKGNLLKKYTPTFGTNDTLFNLYTYDKVNRLIHSELANNTKISYEYDKGQIIKTVHGAQKQNFNDGGTMFPHTTTINKNEGGLITSINDAYGNKTDFLYGSHNKVKSINAYGSTIELSYDEFGNQTQLKDPNAGEIKYKYNAYGNLVSQTNADNSTVYVKYDDLGRVSLKEYPDSTVVSYTYDTENAKGKLGEVIDNKGNEIKYQYDEKGQILLKTEKIKDNTYATQFTYNQTGKVLTKLFPSGFKLAYEYDKVGNIIKLKDVSNNITLWELQEINAHQKITQYKYGNGMICKKFYDAHGVLKQIKTGDILNQTYNFEKETGNLYSRTDSIYNKTEFFAYDKQNRLVYVLNKEKEFILNMSYDKMGNITVKSDVGSYDYDSSLPHAVTSINKDSLSEAENLIRNQSAQYNFNQDLDWIKEHIAETGEFEQKFYYNPLNERNNSELTLNNSLVKSIIYLDDSEIIVTKDSTGQVISNKIFNYISGPTGIIGVYIQNNLTQEEYMWYFHTDYLGSILSISDQEGNIVQEMSYDAWGRARRPDNHSYANVETPILHRGYTMHETLPEFDLIHMNGRLYDPVVARMLSPDNLVQDGLNGQNYNRYSYVLNNPLKYTDPSGEAYVGHAGGGSSSFNSYDNSAMFDFSQIVYVNGEASNFTTNASIWSQPIGSSGGIGGNGYSSSVVGNLGQHLNYLNFSNNVHSYWGAKATLMNAADMKSNIRLTQSEGDPMAVREQERLTDMDGLYMKEVDKWFYDLTIFNVNVSYEIIKGKIDNIEVKSFYSGVHLYDFNQTNFITKIIGNELHFSILGVETKSWGIGKTSINETRSIRASGILNTASQSIIIDLSGNGYWFQ